MENPTKSLILDQFSGNSEMSSQKISIKATKASVTLRINPFACTEPLIVFKDFVDDHKFSGNININNEIGAEIERRRQIIRIQF